MSRWYYTPDNKQRFQWVVGAAVGQPVQLPLRLEAEERIDPQGQQFQLHDRPPGPRVTPGALRDLSPAGPGVLAKATLSRAA